MRFRDNNGVWHNFVKFETLRKTASIDINAITALEKTTDDVVCIYLSGGNSISVYGTIDSVLEVIKKESL